MSCILFLLTVLVTPVSVFFVVVVVVVVVVGQQFSKPDRQTAILSPGPQHILVHSPDYMYLQLYLTLLSRYV